MRIPKRKGDDETRDASFSFGGTLFIHAARAAGARAGEGRRPGRERAFRSRGAHLDSWELGTRALDNGANCTLVVGGLGEGETRKEELRIDD
jgi:hypothetical protein